MIKQKNKLRLDGFYYVNNSSDVKSIDVLLLYNEGFVINEGNYNGLSSNYCLVNIKKENSIENAIDSYKSRLKLLNQSKKIPRSCKILENDLDGKGVFVTNNDSIIIQYYKSDLKIRNQDSFNDYFLHEYRGVVLNDTLFKILKIVNYRDNITKNVELEFKFLKHSDKPKVDSKDIFKNIY
ncbi:hypothetical protein M0M57_05670 [Flavobacterium azooxidireducens]|uniref:Uncharacterized protein n=1 Tax=Flavobacterium azooxidireducens TaxID=1871076 RepID=A0ABY4KIF7_9FLAO|nr:hypothetical protein [Flavobacterium azooxidireducens]UPQ80324.1 hypothetical protein M0M57_05670 [Flavobacterium azooxidireducens]